MAGNSGMSVQVKTINMIHDVPTVCREGRTFCT